MAFPNTMNLTQAPAVEGQCASLNPRHALPGAAAAWTAGTGGVVLGRFAWGDLTGTDAILVSNGTGAPTCIVANEMGAAMITVYLTEYGMTIPAGYQVPGAFIAGDFWVKNTGSATSAVGNKAYAKNTDGTILFDATGQSHSGYTETKWYAATIGAQNELVKMTSMQID